MKNISKIILGMLLVLGVLFILKPVTALAVTVSNQTELQYAIDHVTADSTITLGGNITVTGSAITISNTNSNSFTINLNGKTLEDNTYFYDSSTIIHNGTGNVTISGGTVRTSSSTAISNGNTGSVTISGATVSAFMNYAIINYSGGSVTIAGGTVSADDGFAINNSSTGSVTIEGGTVSADSGYAINNDSTGSVTIAGGTVSANHGYAIYNNSTGIVTIQSGTVTIKSNMHAMNCVPDFNGYINMQIKADMFSMEGTAAQVIASNALDSTNISTYKYLRFEPIPSITSQPADQTVSEGLAATFDITATDNSTLSYQWQVSTNGGTDWTNITGATSAAYTTGATTSVMNNNRYKCLITNAEGGSVTSMEATLTVSAPINYNLWVGGTQVTSANAGNITGDGITGSVTYDSATNTLTLDGANISSVYRIQEAYYYKYGIYSNGQLYLMLNNYNVIGGTAFDGDCYGSLGIRARGSLVINGSGSLNVTSGTATRGSVGIYGDQVIDILGGTITATGGNSTDNYSFSYGIYCGSAFRISGGTVTASCNTQVTNKYAMYRKPTFVNSYTPIVTAGTSEDTAQVVTDISSSYNNNNYVKIEPATVYTVTYKPGTSGTGTEVTDNKTGAVDLTLRGAIFTRTGYTQTGWATSDGGDQSYDLEGSYTANAAVDLYPVWTVIDVPDPDIAIVGNAITAAQNANYSNMTQAAADSEAAINNALKATAEAAVNNSNVTTTINKISYDAPAAGTSADPDGTDGSYTFTVTVAKGTQSQTTQQKTITITATAFTGTTDAQAVVAAKAAIVDGTVNVAYNANQTVKTAAVQTYVDYMISNMEGTVGVTATVTYNSTSGKYDITISKGNESDMKSLTMTVTIAPDPDIAIVGNAKNAAQNTGYSNMTQAAAGSEAAIVNALKATAEAAVNNSNVTTTINKISYDAPAAGTSADPNGTDGTYTFTITVAKGVQSQTTEQKSITITATVYIYNNGNGGNPNTGTTTTTKPAGTIEKDQQREEGAPAATINNNTDNLKASVFTDEEKQKVAAGEDAKVTIKIQDISKSVSDADKKLIEEKLTAEQQKAQQQSSGQTDPDQAGTAPTVLYVDISLYKQIGNGQETRVTETSSRISISIEVPESLWNTDSNNSRTYRVVRVHDGAVEILEGTYDPITHLFTFETDRFSTYALTYQDTKTTSNDTSGDGTIGNTTDTTKDELTAYHDFYHLHLSVKAAKTSQTLKYGKVAGADGYLIYGAICGQGWKQLADVEETVTSYTVKNLKQATYYKFLVKAYKMIDGKQVVIATSRLVRSVTTSKSYGNPTKITSETSSVTLTTGETYTVTCQVVLPVNRTMKDYASLTRYESSDKKVATVSSNGTITAKSKGTCYVYAYAQNGVYTKIKVTVK